MAVWRRAIVVGAFALALVTPGPSSGADAVSEGDAAEALRFRETFGLAADAETLRASSTDPVRYPNLEWGVPLSETEAAEMTRRVGVQDAIGPAIEYAQSEPGFAGIYIDQLDAATPVFVFADDPEAHRAALLALLPDGLRFRLLGADRSYAELQAQAERVREATEQLAQDGILITAVAVDEVHNAVSVGVASDSVRIAEALFVRFGAGLTTRELPPATTDACTVTNCWPPKGGIEITRPTGQCTSGFIAKLGTTSTYGMYTAGHCIALNGGFGANWSHAGTVIGPARYQTWANNAYADAGIININSGSVPPTKNLFYKGSGLTAPLTSIKTLSQQSVGMAVCRSGRTSDVDCGAIYLKDVTRDSCNPSGTICYSIQHTVEVDFDSTGGDSGGAYYSNGGNTGFGIHVHSQADAPGAHGWYSPLNWAWYAYQAQTGFSYNFCLSSTCSTVWP